MLVYDYYKYLDCRILCLILLWYLIKSRKETLIKSSMVLLKAKNSSLEDRQALVEITLTTSSSTLSLSAADDAKNPFQLVLTVRIAASSQPHRPITICTYGTVLDQRPGSFDIMALGAFSPLQCTSDPKKAISLGLWRVNERHKSPSLDLREHDWLQFLTIPAEGSVQITHPLPLSRMFKFEKTLKPEDLRPGEQYRLRMYNGYVGTMWWCWGDLEGDLKEKKFSEWRHGWDGWNMGTVEKPEPDVVEKEGWVLGGDPVKLWVEDVGGDAGFQIVE